MPNTSLRWKSVTASMMLWCGLIVGMASCSVHAPPNEPLAIEAAMIMFKEPIPKEEEVPATGKPVDFVRPGRKTERVLRPLTMAARTTEPLLEYVDFPIQDGPAMDGELSLLQTGGEEGMGGGGTGDGGVWGKFDGSVFSQFFPRKALEAQKNANVILDCTISKRRELTCVVLAEEPSGWDFGEAALKVSRYLRADADLVRNGAVKVAINFNAHSALERSQRRSTDSLTNY